MLVKNYPFIKASSKGVARPYLPIKIINPFNNKDLNAYALIDTGASDLAMPAAFARPLGHKLKRGKLRKIRTVNGCALVYTHSVRIEVFGFSTEILEVDFFPTLNIPLLGVKSFLSNFILTINYPHKCFSISLHHLHNNKDMA